MNKVVSVGGAGLAGCVAAALFKERGWDVHVYETRNHIGGNCYDSMLNNVRVHNYGPHIFHTSDDDVWQFMNRFTTFNDYRLFIKGRLQSGKIIPVPFNLESADITGKDSEGWIRKNVFQYYSEKQWGRPLKDIPKSITDRVMLMKSSRDGRYFGNRYEGIPDEGYAMMFERMLEGCTLHLNQPSIAFVAHQPADQYIYTGSIDELCNYRYGALEYRSLEFDHTTCSPPIHRWINECNNHVAWTRMYDQNQWHVLSDSERCAQGRTVVTREYPVPYDGKNVRMYPIPDDENLKKYKQYITYVKENMCELICLGRLAWFQYVNMDQVVRQVFDTLNNSVGVAVYD